MMTDFKSLLTTLQHADSFFPAGSVAFSHGLEGLNHDGRLADVSAVEVFVLAQIEFRWATLDRGVLTAAWRAGDDLDQLAELDRQQEAMNLASELRWGSRRAGGALLSVHVRLGTRNANAYREWISRERAHGHLAVVQGMLWRASGLSLAEATAASAHSVCVGMLGAAIRLGKIGHVAAQQILTRLRTPVSDILAADAPRCHELHAFTPLADIAVMRHETQPIRLFSS